MLLAIVIGLIAVALVFDFINGFHDAANSIAAAPVLFGGELKVANTMGKGIIHFDELKGQGSALVLTVIFAALFGAIVWNLLTWVWGLPSSSSHALAGGMIGATLPSLGIGGLIPSGILKIVAFIVLSPLIGLVLGASMM